MQIESLEPGEELDWLVLHHVFDWKRGITAFGEAKFRCGPRPYPELLPVSTDLVHAWSVVDHALSVGLTVDMHARSGEFPEWRVRIARPAGEQAEGQGETVSLAICRAALLAVKAALLVKSSLAASPSVPETGSV
jgi:hypothetical protein